MIDTRTANGASGGPKLVAGATRTFNISGTGLCPNTAPAGITAVAINVTLANTDSQGFVTVFPAGTARPLASSINARGPNEVIGNMIIVPLNGAGSVDVYALMGTHFIVDLVGYFFNQFEVGDQLALTGSVSNGAVIVATNNNTVAGSHALGGFSGGAGIVFGVQGQAGNSASTSSAGVRGLAPACCTGTPPVSAGVLGNAGSRRRWNCGHRRL